MNLPADRKVAESETGNFPWLPGSTEKSSLFGKDNV